MKKQYIKPAVEAVEFKLQGSVIASCDFKTEAAMYECPIEIPALGTVFTSLINCDFDNEFGICEFTAEPGMNVYTS